MYISKSKVLLSLILLIFALSPIILAVNLYGTVLSAFPKSPELEIHFYLPIISIIFGSFFLVYIFSFKENFLKRIIDSSGVINIKYFLFLLIISLVIYLIYFVQITYPYLVSSTNDFQNVGISVGANFNTMLLITSTILVFILFFITRKFNYLTANKLFFVIAIFIIVWLSFTIRSLNHYDFAYFAGPINDVLHGKHLLYDAPSQYGFLSIIFLSLIFKFIPLGLMNLTIVNAVIVTLGFILSFILLQFLYKNRLLSLFAIVTIIFLNHTIQLMPEITFLQTSFIRFGMWVLLALSIALQLFYRGKKYLKIVNALPVLVLVLAFFWNLDNGLYVLSAFLTYITFNNLKPSFKDTIKECLLYYLKIACSLLAGLFIFDISYRVLFGIHPNWKIYLFDPFYYLGGFSMTSWPNSLWPWISVGVYITSLIYILIKKRFNKGELTKKDQLMSFILFYGIFQFVYYVGESHLNNLHHISIPFIMMTFYLMDNFLDNFSKVKNNKIYLLVILVLSLVLTLPTYFILLQGVPNTQKYNVLKSVEIIKNKDRIELDYFNELMGEETISLVKGKYGNYISNKGITLISAHDTWFLIKMGMVNNIELNDFYYLTNHLQYQKVADEILQRGDKYIFVDTQMETSGIRSVINLYRLISDRYKIIDTVGTLSVAQKI